MYVNWTHMGSLDYSLIKVSPSHSSRGLLHQSRGFLVPLIWAFCTIHLGLLYHSHGSLVLFTGISDTTHLGLLYHSHVLLTTHIGLVSCTTHKLSGITHMGFLYHSYWCTIPLTWTFCITYIGLFYHSHGPLIPLTRRISIDLGSLCHSYGPP